MPAIVIERTVMDIQNQNDLQKIPSKRLSMTLLILSVILGALSPTSGGLLLTVIAVTLAAIPLLCLSAKGGRPRMIAIAASSYALSCAGAAMISFLASGSFSPICLTAGVYAAIALITALCVYSLKSRFFTESMTAIALSIVMISTVALTVLYHYKAQGITELSSIIKQLDTDVEKYLITTIEETFKESGIASYDAEALDELIKSTWLYTKMLLPGIVYLSSHLIMHISCGIFRRIMLGYYYGSRRLVSWLLSPSAVYASLFILFTGVTTVCDLLWSLFDSNELFTLMLISMNFMLIAFLPCLAFGGRWLKESIRSRKPYSLLTLIALILIACVAGSLALTILAILGAVAKVKEYMSNKADQKIGREH